MIALLGWWGGGGNLPSTYFGAIRVFNEADTLEPSSILIIYAELRAGLYTQWVGQDVILIKFGLNGD